MRDVHVKMKGTFSYFLNPWLRLEGLLSQSVAASGKVHPYVQATQGAAGELVLSAPWWPPLQQATLHANMQSSTAGAATLALIMLALVSVSA
jgi:hypothetical protein